MRKIKFKQIKYSFCINDCFAGKKQMFFIDIRDQFDIIDLNMDFFYSGSFESIGHISLQFYFLNRE